MKMDFSKIKYLKESPDMIFNLMAKYRVNKHNSLQFVKDHMNKITGTNTQGINATEIYTTDNVVTKILEKLEENKDYVRKMNKTIDKAELKQLIQKGDWNAVFNIFTKTQKKEIVYFTPFGIVKLMDDDYKEYHNSHLSALFYNVMLLCLYEIDQSDEEKDKVSY